MKAVKIVSAKLSESGEIEIVRQYPSNLSYCNGVPVADRVVKEIYRTNDAGVIFLAEEVEGRHVPAKMLPERIEF